MTQTIKQFTVKRLRELLKTYKIKITVTRKDDLFNEYISIITKNKNAIIIQKYWRRLFISLYMDTIGPAIHNKSICNNVEDFMTMDELSKINVYEFISYADINKFVYGFSILSLSLLINKNNKNPYNRNIMETCIKTQVCKKIRYNKILNKTITDIIFEPRVNDFVEFFQKLDNLGNYTNVEWITSLSNSNLKKFIHELHDIWVYRAYISTELKEYISPLEDPFKNIPIRYISINTMDDLTLKTYIYIIVNKMVNNNALIEYQTLGAMYILSAITLVNNDAAMTLPWLYNPDI